MYRPGLQAAGHHRPALLPLAHELRCPECGSGKAFEGTRGQERPAQASRCRFDDRQAHSQRGRRGKILSPAGRRQAVAHVRVKCSRTAQLDIDRQHPKQCSQHRIFSRRILLCKLILKLDQTTRAGHSHLP